jgi:DNA-binding response OmpR family regulator
MVKILIMDDEPSLRNIVYNIIKPLGHPVFTAEDGHQALEIGKREIPDIALLDIRVPDMDGLEVLDELKKVNPNIKAIMLSGFGDVESAVFALKRGAFDYIAKPFKVDDIVAVVNKAIATIGGVQPTAQSAMPQTSSQKPLSQAPVKEFKTDSQSKEAAAAVMNTKLIGLIAGGIIALAAAGFLFFGRGMFSATRVESFSIPYTNPIGMCWIKPNLWVSDWVVGNIYQHNNDATMSIASVLKTANSQPTGLAFDGEYLWTCSSVEKRIYKHKMDKTLSVAEIFATPNSSPAGLYFDGANLWEIDTNAAKIYKHKMDESLSIVNVFDSPAVNPCGMFRDGEYFYIGDYKTSRIYKVLVNDFSVREVYTIPGFEEGQYKLANITWDGANIWATADGVGKIFKIPFKSLKTIKF